MRACCWKVVLVQTQVRSVLYEEEGTDAVSIGFADEGTLRSDFEMWRRILRI